MKLCCSCKRRRRPEAFNKRASSKDGLQGHCKECQAAYQVAHALAHAERNARAYETRRREAFEAYGGAVCSFKGCGITDLDVLTIDHVAQDGAEHRRTSGCQGGHGICAWLKRRGYPPGFRVLCMNHNWKVFLEHKREMRA